ncbi:MAG: rhodanese-like domain-containing protein [Bacteroidota bacterium]
MKKLSILFILAFVQFACGQNTATTITPENFKKEIEDSTVVVLDVRTPVEYSEGHIANSVNIDYNADDFATRLDGLDKNKKYEVYCRSGKRSAAATKLMEEKGFKNVHDLQGGILKWESMGYPTVK